MATTTVNIPAMGLVAPSSWGSRESVKGLLKKIWTNYKPYLKFASEQSNIPVDILASFIAVESGGNATAGGSGHITQGLMQWNRTYAKANLEKEYSSKRLSEGEKTKLASFGIKFDANGKTRVITNADQVKPELNILIGSILLGQMIDTDWGTEDNQIKMERVISVYNAGAYGDTGKKARSKTYKTPSDLAKVVNPTTRAYIQKMLGKDGAMDIAKTDNMLV